MSIPTPLAYLRMSWLFLNLVTPPKGLVILAERSSSTPCAVSTRTSGRVGVPPIRQACCLTANSGRSRGNAVVGILKDQDRGRQEQRGQAPPGNQMETLARRFFWTKIRQTEQEG